MSGFRPEVAASARGPVALALSRARARRHWETARDAILRLWWGA